MSDSSDLQRRVLAAFQQEYREQLEVIRAMLAAWPVSPGPVLDEAFRMAHSMKGGARVCDLTEVEGLAHRMESVLSDLTKQNLEPTDGVRRQLETLCDAVEDKMATVDETGAPTPPPKPATAPKLEQAASAPVASAATPTLAGEPAAASPAPAATSGQDVVRIEAVHLERLLQSSGLLMTEVVRQEVLEQRLDAFAQEMDELRKVAADNQGDVGEVRLQLAGLGKSLQRILSMQKEGGRALRVLAEQIQGEVRRACMVPVSTIFEGFPKMMRDLAAEDRKQVRFTMTGSDVQAHRAVLQMLKDPVMHVLRNALAHGIESPEKRRAAGKPEQGEVHLDIQVHGHYLLIRVTDDGRGIDLDAIRAHAVRTRHITQDEADQLSDEMAVELLFQPRFSTSGMVTSVSGRGMGLSVVKERLGQLQGRVRIGGNEGGAGSHVQMEAPVSISAHRMLLVGTSGHVFAIPMPAIRSLIRVSQLHVLEGKTMVLYEGNPVLLATLAEASGAPGALVRGEDQQILVAVLHGERALALHVERFVGEVSAIIQPLPYPASLSPHFSGGVLLQDGNIALVLNLDDLQRRFQGSLLTEQVAPKPASQRKPSILVVDDSFTARTLQKSIFETAGYRVWIAVDGLAALDILRSQSIDAIVSDIQMPRMDGFGLLEAIKSNALTADIPLVLVTSLSSKEDQERGLSLGADAYIIKERFDHRELLATIRQLV